MQSEQQKVQKNRMKAKCRVNVEWKGEDYGPVTWEELSNMRQNSVILFNSELYPGKISEWSLRAEPGRDTKYYICVLCRRLQDKGKRELPRVRFGPPARILVRDGRFLVHPDYPRTPHICGFAENPMSDRAVVLARRAMIRARTEISEDGLTPREKIREVLQRFREDEKYADLSQEEIEQMDNLVCGNGFGRSWSDSSTARSLYINRRKLTSSKHCAKRKIYECPIVGCEFITSAAGMIDVHLSEKHKVADGEPPYNVNEYESEFKLVHLDSSGNPVLPNDINDEALSSPNNSKMDYGPVTLEALSNKRRNTIILYKSKRFSNKMSEWSIKTPSSDVSMYYTCVLCRKIKDSGKRRNPPVDYPPAARIVVRNGRFMVHPDYPKTPHICDFENNPLSDQTSVLSRRRLVRKVNGQKNDVTPIEQSGACEGDRTFYSGYCKTLSNDNYVVDEEESALKLDPAQVHEASFDPVNDPPYHEEAVSFVNEYYSDYADSVSPCSSHFQVNRSSGSNQFAQTMQISDNEQYDIQKSNTQYFRVRMEPNPSTNPRPYECSIVGCKYTTYSQEELNYHLGEHESLDEPMDEFYYEDRSGGVIAGGSHAVVLEESEITRYKHPKIEKRVYEQYDAETFIQVDGSIQGVETDSIGSDGAESHECYTILESFPRAHDDNDANDLSKLSDESEIVIVDEHNNLYEYQSVG